MPGEDFQSWSTTAATNANADTSINWAEGQPRASVNNSARSMMAAHAKDRNLRNGSITTAGTANAQTFTSGVSYTTVPTGLRILLKIGFTNTGATTLSMDSITAVAIKDQSGNDLSAGVLVVGQYAEFLYNGTNWILLEGNLSVNAPACGRLTYVSATALAFKPYNGNSLRIAGAIYPIPAAGIAGLGNTGVFVGGVAAQSLVTGGMYYVYAFNNAGVVTGDFRAFGSNPHSPSATAGNVGTEILTGDDTRTLIGMVLLAPTAAQFLDDANARYVLSWFNRRNIPLTGAAIVNVTTTSTGFIELDANGRANFLIWGDEALWGLQTGYVNNSAATGGTYISLTVDGITTTSSFTQAAIASQWGAISLTYTNFLAEGYHYIAAGGAVTGATGTYNMQMLGRIRG